MDYTREQALQRAGLALDAADQARSFHRPVDEINSHVTRAAGWQRLADQLAEITSPAQLDDARHEGFTKGWDARGIAAAKLADQDVAREWAAEHEAAAQLPAERGVQVGDGNVQSNTF